MRRFSLVLLCVFLVFIVSSLTIDFVNAQDPLTCVPDSDGTCYNNVYISYDPKIITEELDITNLTGLSIGDIYLLNSFYLDVSYIDNLWYANGAILSSNGTLQWVSSNKIRTPEKLNHTTISCSGSDCELCSEISKINSSGKLELDSVSCITEPTTFLLSLLSEDLIFNNASDLTNTDSINRCDGAITSTSKDFYNVTSIETEEYFQEIFREGKRIKQEGSCSGSREPTLSNSSNICQNANNPEQCVFLTIDKSQTNLGLPGYLNQVLTERNIDVSSSSCTDLIVLSSGFPTDDYALSENLGQAGCGRNQDYSPTYDCFTLSNVELARDSYIIPISTEYPFYHPIVGDYTYFSGEGVYTDVMEAIPTLFPQNRFSFSITPWPSLNPFVHSGIGYEGSSGSLVFGPYLQGDVYSFRVADSGDSLLDSLVVVMPSTCFTDEDPVLFCDGTLPQNTISGNKSYTGTNDPSSWTYVSSTPSTCEFTCDSGYEYDSTSNTCEKIDIPPFCEVRDANTLIHYPNATYQQSFNRNAFAAIRADGSVVTWGDPLYGGNSSAVAEDLSSGVIGIYSTDSAFAALKEDGSVVTWGNPWESDASSVQNQLVNVTKMFSFEDFFVALKEDGSVVLFGDLSDAYIDGLTDYPEMYSDTTSVFYDGEAILLLQSDGRLLHSSFFLPSDPNAYVINTDVKTLYQYKNFQYNTDLPFSRTDHIVHYNNNSIQFSENSLSLGYGINDLDNVSYVQTSPKALFIAYENDTVIPATGNEDISYNYGYDLDLTNVVSMISSGGSGTASTFAIKGDGTGFQWGSSTNGVFSRVVQPLLQNISKVVVTDYSFLVLLENGTIISTDLYTNANSESVYGGTFSLQGFENVSQDGLDTDIVDIYSSLYGGFAAIKSNGDILYMPRLSSDSHYPYKLYDMGGKEVNHIFSNNYAFAALLDDGSVFTFPEEVHGGNSSLVSAELNDPNNPVVVINGDVCVAPTTTSCSGTLPENTITGSSTYTGTPSTTSWTYVSSTPSTCEFTCDTGYLYNETSGQCDVHSTSPKTWYLDADQDGFANATQESVSSPGANWYDIVMPVNDCNDTDRRIHPYFTEADVLCFDGIDNDCNGLVDEEDPKCSTGTCPAGFSNFALLEESASLYVNSESFDVCLNDSTQAETYLSTSDCGTDNTILYYDEDAQLVAVPSQQTAAYETQVCSQMNCYVATSNSCGTGFTKILGLPSLVDSKVSPPEANSDNSLCCQTFSQGLYFNTVDGKTQLMCSEISDGFCPEDFESADGEVISCSLVRDPDCGYNPVRDTSNFVRKLFTVDFDEEVYVESATNSDGSRVAVTSRDVTYNESATNINYEFKIVSTKHVDHSITNLVFSFAQSAPDVFFDNVLVAECDSFDSPLVLPCSEWDKPTLTLHHSLSVHDVRVNLTFKSLRTFFVLIALFAILIPVLVVAAIRTNGFKKVRSSKGGIIEKDITKITSFVERKLSEGLSKSRIKTLLRDVGWEDHIVSLALHGAHVKHKDYTALENYIKECLDKQIPRSKMFAALLAAGWDKDEVEDVYEKLNI